MPRKEPAPVWEDVPEAHRQAAEEIRSHLVALRGGAPFLSPDDARLLLQWLDAGVSVGDILCALERAAESRRKRRSRIPLALRHAKRHLGKVPRVALQALPEPVDAASPLHPLVVALRHQAVGAPRADALHGLAADLERLPRGDAETLLRGALGSVRKFFTGTWEAMADSERRARLDAAREEFAEIADAVDEATLLAAIEEHARDRLRQDYPHLTAATLWDLVHR